MRHYIKIAPKYFIDIEIGCKNFELRVNDRDYKEGDTLVLQEYNHTLKNPYTGREIERYVPYILYGGVFGLPENMCIMALSQTCIGCKWHSRHQKCACCRRNKGMKDNYTRSDKVG